MIRPDPKRCVDYYDSSRILREDGVDAIAFMGCGEFTLDDVVTIHRSILHRAILDYVGGDIVTKASMYRWIHSYGFEWTCMCAHWEEDWVRRIFIGLDSLGETDTKYDIAKQIVSLLAKMPMPEQ